MKAFTQKIILFITTATLSFSATALTFEEARILAKQGDEVNQYNLGVMYVNGMGVRQDYAKAMEWFTKAANQGYVKAQYNLGVMYDNGKGVRPDYAKAIEWLTKAADQEHADAQYNLGVMYVNGEGVRYDISTAMEWYGKACDNGSQMGCDKYKAINLYRNS